MKPDRGSGNSGDQRFLQQHEAESGCDSDLLRLEERREVFRWASRKVVNEFRTDTWQAFWLTAIEGRSAEEAANELGKRPGAIYAARSRIMRRIQEVVTEYESQV